MSRKLKYSNIVFTFIGVLSHIKRHSQSIIQTNNDRKGEESMKKYIVTIFLSSVLLLLVACGKTTYELDRALSVEFEGYDEYGIAIISVDKTKVYNDLSEVKKLNERNELAELDSIISSLQVEASQIESLKNGEEVELRISYDEDNRLDIAFELNEPKVTVQNLEPITTLSQEDIFEAIEIQYEGVSPFLQARIVEDTTNEMLSLFTYSIPESDKFYKVDDEVEVIAEPKTELIQSGYKADEEDFSFTIKVPDQQKYVISWAELNEDDQKYIMNEIQDLVVARIDSRIQDNSVYEKGSYITMGRYIDESGESILDETYFLFLKELESGPFGYYDDVNSIRFIYKNEITFGEVFFNREYDHKTKDYYSVVGASNLIIDEDGNLDRNAVDFATFSNPDTDKVTVTNETVNKNKDKYNVDSFDMNES